MTYASSNDRRSKPDVAASPQRDAQSALYPRIVVAADFSPVTTAAVAEALRIACRDGGAVHVVHVFNAPWHRLHYRAPTLGTSPDDQARNRADLESRLQAFIAPLAAGAPGIEITYVAYDAPSLGHGLRNYIATHGGDLVVVGTHRGRRPPIFNTPRVEALAGVLACPVLVVTLATRPAC